MLCEPQVGRIECGTERPTGAGDDLAGEEQRIIGEICNIVPRNMNGWHEPGQIGIHFRNTGCQQVIVKPLGTKCTCAVAGGAANGDAERTVLVGIAVPHHQARGLQAATGTDGDSGDLVDRKRESGCGALANNQPQIGEVERYVLKLLLPPQTAGESTGNINLGLCGNDTALRSPGTGNGWHRARLTHRHNSGHGNDQTIDSAEEIF